MQPEIQYCAKCNALHAPGQHNARPKPRGTLNEESLAECIAEVRSGVDSKGRKIAVKPTHIILKADQPQKSPKAKSRPNTSGKPTAAQSPSAPVNKSDLTTDPKKMSRQELEALVAKVLAEKAHKRKLKAKHQATWRSRQKKEKS